MILITKFLILSIPFSLVFSIFFLEISLLILSCGFFYKLYQIKNFNIFNNFFIKIIFLFSLYLIFGFIFFQPIEIGYKYSFFYFRYGIYIISLAYFLKELKFEKNFLISFLIINLLLFFDSLLQFITGTNSLNIQNQDLARVSSFFNNEKILGGFITKISPFVFSLFFLTSSKKNYLYYLIFLLTILANIYIVLISGERAALFLYILLCFYLFVFLIIDKKIKFYFLIITAIFFTIFIFFNKNAYNRIVDQTLFEVFGKDFAKEKYYDGEALIVEDYFKNECQKQKIKAENCKSNLNFYFFSPTHHNYYLTSLRIFSDHKVFGAGPKSFRVLCKEEKYSINKFSCATHPHNYYIQLISETGIIGLSYLIIIYFYFFYLLFKIISSTTLKKNSKNFYITILGALVINYFPFIPTGNFFNNWLSILSYLPIVYLLNDKNFNK
tara:strand:+ start:403 stop:1722 length:1320 start_codon:yes stop_codon:yes gene_type:complete